MAFTFGLTRSICARCADMTSRAETCLPRIRATSSMAPRWQRSSARACTFAAGARPRADARPDGTSAPPACSVLPITAAPTACPKLRRLIACAELAAGIITIDPGPKSLAEAASFPVYHTPLMIWRPGESSHPSTEAHQPRSCPKQRRNPLQSCTSKSRQPYGWSQMSRAIVTPFDLNSSRRASASSTQM